MGLSIVYPFYLSTTLEPEPATATKAFIQAGGIVTTSVTKRDTLPATATVIDASATFVVFGDELTDEKQHRAIALQNRHSNRIQPNPVARSMVTPPAHLAARQAPPAPAPSCSFDFDISGAEDIEVGGAGFDQPPTEDLSSPQCGTGILVPLTDLQNVINSLDDQGDDGYQFDSCGGGGSPQRLQQGNSGLARVDLCSGTEQKCIRCAELANYLQGMAGAL